MFQDEWGQPGDGRADIFSCCQHHCPLFVWLSLQAPLAGRRSLLLLLAVAGNFKPKFKVTYCDRNMIKDCQLRLVTLAGGTGHGLLLCGGTGHGLLLK